MRFFFFLSLFHKKKRFIECKFEKGCEAKKMHKGHIIVGTEEIKN